MALYTLLVIRGAHVVVFSTDAEADRVFFRDVLECPFADAGNGWLIFDLPPAELAVHPAQSNGPHEMYLVCDDIEAFIKQMAERSIPCSPVQLQRWGRLVHLTLPGGGELGVYEPTHPLPPSGAR